MRVMKEDDVLTDEGKNFVKVNVYIADVIPKTFRLLFPVHTNVGALYADMESSGGDMDDYATAGVSLLDESQSWRPMLPLMSSRIAEVLAKKMVEDPELCVGDSGNSFLPSGVVYNRMCQLPPLHGYERQGEAAYRRYCTNLMVTQDIENKGVAVDANGERSYPYTSLMLNAVLGTSPVNAVAVTSMPRNSYLARKWDYATLQLPQVPTNVVSAGLEEKVTMFGTMTAE